MTLKGIEIALKVSKEMNVAMIAAYAKACEAARMFENFAEEHSLVTAIFVTLIAIEVLMILASYVVEMLGLKNLSLLKMSLRSISVVL